MEKVVIGRVEKVGINGVCFLAKIDTGAYKNSICENIAKKLDLKPVGETNIRNAQGRYKRKVVEADLVIRNKHFKTNFTVANRSDLKYDVLIGRGVLKGNFVVDPSLKNETGCN